VAEEERNETRILHPPLLPPAQRRSQRGRQPSHSTGSAEHWSDSSSRIHGVGKKPQSWNPSPPQRSVGRARASGPAAGQANGAAFIEIAEPPRPVSPTRQDVSYTSRTRASKVCPGGRRRLCSKPPDSHVRVSPFQRVLALGCMIVQSYACIYAGRPSHRPQLVPPDVPSTGPVAALLGKVRRENGKSAPSHHVHTKTVRFTCGHEDQMFLQSAHLGGTGTPYVGEPPGAAGPCYECCRRTG